MYLSNLPKVPKEKNNFMYESTFSLKTQERFV